MGRLFVFFVVSGMAVFAGGAAVFVSSCFEGFFCVGEYSSKLFCAIPRFAFGYSIGVAD